MSEADYMMESQWGDIADADMKEQEAEAYDKKTDAMRAQYRANKLVRVGATIKCSCGCGVAFVKKSYQSQFARNKGANNCKDKFWNNTDEKRRSRAQPQKYLR